MYAGLGIGVVESSQTVYSRTFVSALKIKMIVGYQKNALNAVNFGGELAVSSFSHPSWTTKHLKVRAETFVGGTDKFFCRTLCRGH